MAFTDNADRLNMSFPIVKMEETKDGDLTVWGKATDGSIDSDDQIVDTDWSAKALEEWLKSGANIRVQHSPYLYPAGKGVEIATSDDGHWVKALIVEPTAKELCKKGVLQAFSVGIARPKIIRDSAAKGGRIVDGKLIEISLVDRPANANCGFTLVKSANGTLVDTDDLFGDISAALAAAEEKVDLAVEQSQATVSQRYSAADISEWMEDRKQFLDSMPEDTSSADWQEWSTAKSVFYSTDSVSMWIAKRDFDKGVGGGVDRSKVPAEDFAGPNRTFPIVTPSDVSDAASLVGHADNPGQVKSRIVAIAHRKGPDFVAALPDAWKSTDVPEDADTQKSTETAEVEKGQKDCPGCGKSYDGDSKQRSCEGCGKDLPHAKSDDAEVEKGITDAVGDSADGKGVDASDHMDNRDDEGLKPAALKSELPYSLKRLHDVTCGVFSEVALRNEYASLKSWADAVNVDVVREHLGDEAADAAEVMKAADPDMLADARAQLHKSFADMYPTAHCTPGSIQPGSFRRGFLSAGHYRENASGSDSGARIPSGGSTPSAGDFTRGNLSEGHERPSPASKGVKEEGSAAYTRNAVQSLHEHICTRVPEVCAWGPSTQVDNKAEAVLTPVHPSIPDGPNKSADAEYIKALVADAFATKSEYYENEISVLKAQIEVLGAQPDPALAPVRGVVAKSAGVGKAAEAAPDTEATEETREERLVAYARKSQYSGDPAVRMRAEAVLQKYASTSD